MAESPKIKNLPEWKAYLQREVSHRRWAEGALEFAEGLDRLQNERAAAEAGRDAAKGEMEKILADLAAKKEQYARDGAKALEELGESLKRRQGIANAELEATRVELAEVRKRIEQAKASALEMDATLKRVRETCAAEEKSLRERIASLRSEDQSLTERLAAVLKR